MATLTKEWKEQHPDYFKKRTEERKALGLCSKCPNKADNGKGTCLECRERISAYKKNQIEERVKLGLCIKCGKLPFVDAKHSQCAVCHDKQMARVRKCMTVYKTEGWCHHCSNKARQGKTLCEDCSIKQKQAAIDRTADGTCLTCHSPRRQGKKQCSNCALRHKLCHHNNLSEELYNAQLSRQDGGCAVCGEKFSDKVAPCVDHEHGKEGCTHPHKTGCDKCFRSLLCASHNSAVGLLGDNITLAIEGLLRLKSLARV